VRESLKSVPVTREITLAEQVDASIVPERLLATLSGLFGALGLLIAAVGIYGLLSYTTQRRTHEIGIRMALGGSRHAVAGMVLRDALKMVCAGLLIGTPLAFSCGRLAASLLPDLEVTIGAPLIFGTATILVAALLAAWIPAHRAARIDPMNALRHE
jgi:putative ABC transport system permease protein